MTRYTIVRTETKPRDESVKIALDVGMHVKVSQSDGSEFPGTIQQIDDGKDHRLYHIEHEAQIHIISSRDAKGIIFYETVHSDRLTSCHAVPFKL